MDPLADIVAALAAIPERQLNALRAAIEGSPNIVPGLLAWLEGASDWEINRRAGFAYELLGPMAAIDDTEVERSLVTLAALAAQFRNEAPVANFFALSAALLRASAPLLH